MNQENELILVNVKDEEIGFMPKMETHEKGLLHRAFSILVFNIKGEFLIQKRAEEKYHSGGLWSNTCCSHPIKGEEFEKTLQRRLKEEMGFECALNFAYKFQYRVDFENGLSEAELDHVFLGEFNGEVILNKEEASDYKWIGLSELRKNIKINPENFTFWFKEIIEKHLKDFAFPKR